MVGNVAVGGDAPVTVQTMTNTPTSDARATIDQIRRCEEAGADIIRVSCPDVESTAALRTIVREASVPIVAALMARLVAANANGGPPASRRLTLSTCSSNSSFRSRYWWSSVSHP